MSLNKSAVGMGDVPSSTSVSVLFNKPGVTFAPSVQAFPLDASLAPFNVSLSASKRSAAKRLARPVQTGSNVGKVRWLQDSQAIMIPDPYATEYFVTGACSALPRTTQNKFEISLYRLQVDGSDEEGKRVDLMTKTSSSSHVTDISVLDPQTFAVATGHGQVFSYKCGLNNQEEFDSITEVAGNQFHGNSTFSCPATALSVKESLVSVGEDGCIVELSINTFQEINRLDSVDPLSIYSVSHVGRSEILTGNAGGQLKLWDLRSGDKTPRQTMHPNVLLNNLYGAISIAQHPSQSHLVIVGYQSGLVDLWDLRLGTGCDPVANLATESGSLSEIYFHKVNPDHFYSCAQSGQVCHWYPKLSPTDMEIELMEGEDEEAEPESSIDFLRRLVFKELYVSPLPVNSLSLSKNDRLVCGGDSGIVYCTELASSD